MHGPNVDSGDPVSSPMSTDPGFPIFTDMRFDETPDYPHRPKQYF